MLRIPKQPLVGIAAFVLLFPILAERMPAIAHYPDILIFAGIYCLITMGMSLLMGYAGQISLGHAAFFGIGAYASGILTVHAGINPWLAMGIGMVAAGAVALVVGAPALQLRGHYLAMATLAFGIIIFIVFNEEAAYTGGPDGLSGIPGLRLFGFAFNSMTKYYYLVWTVVLAALVFVTNVIESPTGRALRAIHASEAAASAMGIAVNRGKVVVFIFSAMLAALAGSFYAHYMNFVNPSSFDLFFSVKLVIMIALGGMHHIWGALLGAVLITFLSMEWLHAFDEYEVIVYGIILLVTTLFLPDGLVGWIESKMAKRSIP